MTPAIIPHWRWKTNNGPLMRPADMETRHLHHTLVMIWHHTMPEEARVRPQYRLYSFGPFFTREYMLQAVQEMAAELSARDDLTPQWKDELRRMKAYLSKISGTLQAQPKRIPQ